MTVLKPKATAYYSNGSSDSVFRKINMSTRVPRYVKKRVQYIKHVLTSHKQQGIVVSTYDM